MNRINSFSELNSKRLLKKLKSAENRMAFRSTVSEIRFGEFFQKLNFEIEYDKKINNQTPDWTLNVSSFPIICDVYRLGQSNKDQARSDFENSLKEQLEKIPSELVINIKIDQNYSNYEESQIDRIKAYVESWLENSPSVNDKTYFEYDIKFKVRGKSNNLKFLSCINSNIIDYKIGKVQQIENQRPNEITKKMKKYIDVINIEKLPFFICVDIDFASGFNHDEFEEYFLGSSVSFVDFDPNNLFSTDIGTLGTEWTELGKFYQNIHISGIITCINDEFKVLLNPVKKQLFYEDQYQSSFQKLQEHCSLM